MWNVFCFVRKCLFAACLLAATGGLASAQVATNDAHASLGGLVGFWRGNAVLNGDPTPVWVESSLCEGGVCGRLSLPDLDTQRLPLGPLAADDEGTLSASVLSLAHEGSRLVGSFAGADGDVFIAAMSHGEGPASISLSRSAPPDIDVREEDVTFHNGEIALAGTP